MFSPSGNVILSRTRLERMIQEFNLYPEERRHATMEDVVENMRKNVDIDTNFRATTRSGWASSAPSRERS